MHLNSGQIINLISAILITHFVADFVFQTRKMGEGKSSSLYWLTVHVLTYTTVLGTMLSWILIPRLGYFHFFGFVLLNGILHFITDFLSSKMTTYFYLKAEAAKYNNALEQDEKIKLSRRYMKGFWTAIGADQLIHGIILVQTIKLYIL